MKKKKIRLLLDNIQNLIDTLRLEIEEDDDTEQPKNTISLPELIKNSGIDLDEDIEYAEEPDKGPDILLNSKEEQEFYARFRLGE